MVEGPDQASSLLFATLFIQKPAERSPRTPPRIVYPTEPVTIQPVNIPQITAGIKKYEV